MKTVALLLAATVVFLTGGSASAQPGPIGLSVDGTHWSTTLAHPLFNSSYRWVPGDTQLATLYVRNQSGRSAVMSVALVSGALRDAILSQDFVVYTSIDGRKSTPAHPPGSQMVVALGPSAVGSVHRVKILVSMSRSSTNQAQTRRFDLNVRVSLSQEPTSLGGGFHPGTPRLPDTGSPVTPTLLAAIALFLITGFGLMRYSRRTTHPNERRP